MFTFIYFPLVFILAFCLTGMLRAYALKHNVIDAPNARSSHSVPTPRGGGLSVVVSFIVGLIFSFLFGNTPLSLTLVLIAGGMSVALIGWLDDHGHVNARWRLLVHFSAACLIVFVCGGLPIISFSGLRIDFGLVGYFISVVALVWLLNLYNFMDGIDGLAGGQAVLSTGVLGLFLYILFDQLDLAILHWILAACSLAFLFWNFPVAKIFMGDAGSGFIGIMLGSLLIISSHIDQALFWAWLIILGVFIVDATYTLFRRFINGEKVSEAHSSHAYQHAARKFKSHKIVTISIYSIIVVWLTPIALYVSMYKLEGLTGLIVAYLPLILLCFFFKAGAGGNKT